MPFLSICFLLYRGLFTFAAAGITTETLVYSLCYKDGIAVVTHAQRGLVRCQHEAEHHLQTNQLRMEVPNNSGFVQ